MRQFTEPTGGQIALDRWTQSRDSVAVRSCRRLRRWLGLGCRAEPWKDAAPDFRCSRSIRHSDMHVAKTLNGPICWEEGRQLYMPPHAPFVRSPSKKEFDLVVLAGGQSRESAFTHHLGVHTKEQHVGHQDLAAELGCVAIGHGLYAAPALFLNDETAAILMERQRGTT